MMKRHVIFSIVFFIGSQVSAFNELEGFFEGSDAKQERCARIVGALIKTGSSSQTKKRAKKVVHDIKKLENSLRDLAFDTLEDLIGNLETKEDAQEVLTILSAAKKLAEEAAAIQATEDSIRKRALEAQFEQDSMLFIFNFLSYLPALKQHEASLKVLEQKLKPKLDRYEQELLQERNNIQERWRALIEKFEQKLRSE